GPAPAALLGRIGVARDERMGGQERLHAGALHADAAAVDQPDLGEAAGMGGDQVFVDDGADVLRAEGMQVERILGWEGNPRRVPLDPSSLLRSGGRPQGAGPSAEN